MVQLIEKATRLPRRRIQDFNSFTKAGSLGKSMSVRTPTFFGARRPGKPLGRPLASPFDP